MIERKVAERVCTLTIDNAPVNALTSEDLQSLLSTLVDLGEDASVDAVVVTGRGDRAFSAGMDVNEIRASTPASSLRRKRLLVSVLTELTQCRKPVVAAVNGAVVGAGLMLVAACDVAVAADGAVLRLPEIDVGVIGGARHAMQLLPPPVVRYMVLSGAPLTASEAQRLGAFVDVFPRERLLPEALGLAQHLASKDPAAYAMWKDVLRQLDGRTVSDGWALEQRASLWLEARVTTDPG